MYVGKRKFIVPEDIPNAKSIIILAKKTPIAYIDFIYNGNTHSVTIPPQYFDHATEREGIENYIMKNIFLEPNSHKKYEIKRAVQVFAKLLAVRSGLAKYGRNNLSYVGEMGSFHYLYAYFTDYVPEKYDWSDRTLMESCENCRICERMCPTSAIHEGDFLVDVDKCITLYNEVEGDFPEIIAPEVHNALMGCLKCQYFCPGNIISKKNSVKLETITEEETNMILTGEKDETLIKSITTKLRMFKYEEFEEMLPILSRNLSVLLKN